MEEKELTYVCINQVYLVPRAKTLDGLSLTDVSTLFLLKAILRALVLLLLIPTFLKKRKNVCKPMDKSAWNPCSVCGKIRNQPHNQSTRVIFDLIKHNLHNIVSDILTSYCYYLGTRVKDFQNYPWSKYSIFIFSSCNLTGNNFFHLRSAVCSGGGRMGLGLCCNSYCYSYHHNFHW